MKDIIILGAGGAALNILEYIEDINELSLTWNILGLLDDNINLHNSEIMGYKVLGSIEDSIKWPNAFYISSIGSAQDLELRKLVRDKVPFSNDSFATIIHPKAHVSKTAIIEPGCIICPFTSLQSHTHIKHDSYITSFTLVGHESVIGEHCVVAGRTMIAGSAIIGDCTYIGCGSTLKHEIFIGDHCMIGMGAVLWKNAEPFSKYYAPHARTKEERIIEKNIFKN
ncbi:hypothetical protein E0494_06155 [Marinilabiliaceae bacterium JC040]|nr:hypothetical protein [Marinilabiliaceae bacterium JC040]